MWLEMQTVKFKLLWEQRFGRLQAFVPKRLEVNAQLETQQGIPHACCSSGVCMQSD